MRSKKYLLFFLALIGLLNHTCPSQVNPAVTAKEVCKFVVEEMNAALPQTPTLCAPKDTSSGSYELSVFSPTDVLEGKLRRAWSSSLFITLSNLYFGESLHGACKSSLSYSSPAKSWFGCIFLISDSYLSQHYGKQYKILDPGSYRTRVDDPLHKDASSDEWYRTWWSQLRLGQQWDLSGTSENARDIAHLACTRYLAALRRDPLVDLKPGLMPIPSCSVLLATNTRADIIINFTDSEAPSLINYEQPLIETFGETFDTSPYVGEVFFRGPWDSRYGEPMRSNWSYELSDLEFNWEEISSGVRSYASTGRKSAQTQLRTGEVGSGIVLKTLEVPGRGRLLDLTNGSEWLIFSDAESEAQCALTPGIAVVHTTEGKMEIIGGSCGGFKATFASGW